MAGSGGDLTDALVALVVGTRTANLPDTLLHEAKRALLNGFATAMGAASDPELVQLAAAVERFSGPAEAGQIGRAGRVDRLSAAFVNAAAINLHDFDDTHPGTILHPTAPVAPVVLAITQTQTVGGTDLLSAFALGVEVECRLANAVSPGHYRRGWHITATCGIFGAAAAAGRLLKLDARQMRNAFGIAAAQSSGTVEALGTMAKSVGVGNAARGGYWAALLAAEGLEGPARPIEGAHGFLALASEAPSPQAVMGADRWQLLLNTYKPYPCGVVLNPVIEACLDLRARSSFDPRMVEAVTIHGHALLRERADRPAITTGRQSQVSAQHAVAVCLLRGEAGLSEFSDEAVGDPKVRHLAARVQVAEDTALGVGQVRVAVALASGGLLECSVMSAKGDSERPLTDQDIAAKLVTLARYGRPGVDPQPLIEAVWNLDASADASQLMRLAAPATA